jgi:hypothetical protein
VARWHAGLDTVPQGQHCQPFAQTCAACQQPEFWHAACPRAKALAVCGRSLAKLALTEEEIESIRAPVTVLVGDKDALVKKLHVDPLKTVRRDWPVIEIKDANHITCILKQEFREEIAAWLMKNTR